MGELDREGEREEREREREKEEREWERDIYIKRLCIINHIFSLPRILMNLWSKGWIPLHEFQVEKIIMSDYCVWNNPNITTSTYANNLEKAITNPEGPRDWNIF